MKKYLLNLFLTLTIAILASCEPEELDHVPDGTIEDPTGETKMRDGAKGMAF